MVPIKQLKAAEKTIIDCHYMVNVYVDEKKSPLTASFFLLGDGVVERAVAVIVTDARDSEFRQSDLVISSNWFLAEPTHIHFAHNMCVCNGTIFVQQKCTVLATDDVSSPPLRTTNNLDEAELEVEWIIHEVQVAGNVERHTKILDVRVAR